MMPHPNLLNHYPDLLPATVASGPPPNDTLYSHPGRDFDSELYAIAESGHGGSGEAISREEQISQNTRFSKEITESMTAALWDLMRKSTTEDSPAQWPEVARHERAMMKKILKQQNWTDQLRVPPGNPASHYTFQAAARENMPQYPYDVSLWITPFPADPAEQDERWTEIHPIFMTGHTSNALLSQGSSSQPDSNVTMWVGPEHRLRRIEHGFWNSRGSVVSSQPFGYTSEPATAG